MFEKKKEENIIGVGRSQVRMGRGVNAKERGNLDGGAREIFHEMKQGGQRKGPGTGLSDSGSNRGKPWAE